MATRPMLLYMVTIRDAITRGDIEEMRGLSKTLRAILANTDDAESAESNELRVAADELLSAISERSSVELEPADVVAIHEGMVWIDSIALARALKGLIDTDAEIKWSITVKIGN